MSRASRLTWSHLRAKFLPVAVVGTAGLALTGSAVFASLTATAFNSSAEAITSSTLSLTMTPTLSSNGFTTSITNMAPGDTQNRYVTVANGSGLAGIGLTLGLADANSDTLTSDATKGLQVTVSSCSVSWVPTTGVCAGITTVIGVSTPAATLKTTPVSLGSGAIAAGAAYNLQVSIVLPSSTEATANGVTPGSSIQGQSASVTWTFTETQRAGTTTNS